MSNTFFVFVIFLLNCRYVYKIQLIVKRFVIITNTPYGIFCLLPRLEAEVEKMQNSSRSADTTPFSTPCWSATSPWEHNGTVP